MRNGGGFPPWLARRGYPLQLKRRLSSAGKLRRMKLDQANPAQGIEPQGAGKAIELQQYLTWRMAEVG
jgi:hypothetical protein